MHIYFYSAMILLVTSFSFYSHANDFLISKALLDTIEINPSAIKEQYSQKKPILKQLLGENFKEMNEEGLKLMKNYVLNGK